MSEDQAGIRDLARRFGREDILPAAAHYDRTMVRSRRQRSDISWADRCLLCLFRRASSRATSPPSLAPLLQEYPWPLIKKAHSLGLLNTHIPTAYGGPELGLLECASISEELAYGCSGVQTAMEGTWGA